MVSFLCGEKTGENDSNIVKYIHGKDKKGKRQEGGGGGNNFFKMLILFSTFSLSYPLKTGSFHPHPLNIFSILSSSPGLNAFVLLFLWLASLRCCNNSSKNLML